VLDAVTIGVIYCRLARPHARASTIIFSNKVSVFFASDTLVTIRGRRSFEESGESCTSCFSFVSYENIRY